MKVDQKVSVIKHLDHVVTVNETWVQLLLNPNFQHAVENLGSSMPVKSRTQKFAGKVMLTGFFLGNQGYSVEQLPAS